MSHMLNFCWLTFSAHTHYQGSVLLIPQTIIPQLSCTSPLWNQTPPSQHIPAHPIPVYPSTSQHTQHIPVHAPAAQDCCPSRECRLRAPFSCIQADPAGDVLVSVAAIIKPVVCNLLGQKRFVQNIIQWDRAGRR